MGDDWTMDVLDELVKKKPEHRDIRDALKHGKNQGQGDQSSRKHSRNMKKARAKPSVGPWNPELHPGTKRNKSPLMHTNGRGTTST